MGVDNRTRTERFKKLVSLFLASEGIPNEPRPYLLSRRQKLEIDLTPGHIQGIPRVLVNAQAERQFRPSDQVARAKAEAAEDDVEFYFTVQHRQGMTDPADALVFTDLRTLAALLVELKNLRAAS